MATASPPAVRRRPFHVVRVEIADAVIRDLARVFQSFEAFEGLRQRGRSAPVQQVEIDAVRPEPAQALLTCLGHQLSGGVVGVEFAYQEYLFAAPGDGFSHHLFRAAFAVHLSGIDEGHPEIETQPERGGLLPAVGAVLSHTPSSLAEGGDRHTRW